MNNKYYIKNFKTVFNNEKVIVCALSVNKKELLEKVLQDTHIPIYKPSPFFRIENGRVISIYEHNLYDWFLWGYNLVNIFKDKNGYYFTSI